MKISGINGGVMYTGGVFKTTKFSQEVYEDEADCSKVIDILNKYGKDSIHKVEYIYNNKTEVVYSRKKISGNN